MFSKGTRSGNGRASIPHVLSGVISLLLGAGTLNCGFPLWPESLHIRQLGHFGVSQGDPVDAEFSADAGSTFLLGKSRQSVVKVLECKQFVPMNRLVHVSVAVGECIAGGRLPSARVSEICLHTFLIF